MWSIRRILELARAQRRFVVTAVGFLIMLGLLMFVVGVTTWEYTNSTAFCGTTCHTMPPEYTAYQHSPHARVPCVDCHLGRESALNAIPRKAGEISHVTSLLLAEYDTPIYAKTMRRAWETCEECHNPRKFSADTFREITHYGLDERNTPIRTYLVLKTGGQVRPGLSRGIHWHIANQVWFLATDWLKQDIVYVREIREDGTTNEYYDVEAGVDAEYVAQHEDQLRLMDCIDCHNRISHTFPSPERAMDQAIAQGRIDENIPFIKTWGVDVLGEQFRSHEEARRETEKLEVWYQQNYPDFYTKKRNSIRVAIEQIKKLYTETVFPDMDIGWATHPDNLGHKEFPGCFRCHDGKHLSPEDEAIRLECNLCHGIPEVTGPGLPAPVINVARADEPASHRDTNWLALHQEERYAADAGCARCHSMTDAGKATNISFCSNSACHGVAWVFAGLNAPALRARLALEPVPAPPPGAKPPVEAPVPPFVLDKTRGPDVPHPLSEPRRKCLLCHTIDGLIPAPADHADYAQEECTDCHRPAWLMLEETGQ
ncbi:MAG: cytochrome c3 family protein [Anaerolineae bacterium]